MGMPPASGECYTILAKILSVLEEIIIIKDDILTMSRAMCMRPIWTHALPGYMNMASDFKKRSAISVRRPLCGSATST